MFNPHTVMIATLLPPLLLLLVPVCCSTGEAEPSPPPKHYYVAAVEIGWDYIHLDEADPESEQRRSKDIPQKYIKAVYREYTDSTYTEPKPTPAWTGIQGPVIVAQANDRLVVHFKNLASQSYSISPVGISYWKQSEGAGYDDSTTGQEKEDDAVPPGGYYEYVWDINPKVGPTISDPECLTYSYSSQVDPVRDVNSGLIGALLICKSSAFGKDGQKKNPPLVLLFAVFDETKSWYGEVGAERRSREKFKGSNHKKEYHTINGYVNSTLPGLKVCQGRNLVSWHLIGMGTTPGIHSIQFQDHTLQVLNHRKATMEVTPMTFITAELKPTSIGRFLISCQIQAHRHDGMNAMFVVEKCSEPATAPGPDLRKVKYKDDENISYDYYDDNLFNSLSFHTPQVQARSSRGEQSRTWEHFIAIEEVMWEYAGHLKPTDSELQSKYLSAAPHHLGYRYKKVAYVEYTDGSFTKKKNPGRVLLGPLLKGKVNDRIQITLRNMADRPFNIYPNGLTQVYPLDRSSKEKDLRSMGVPPNGTFTYVWKLTVDDGPLKEDPQCLIQLYQSTFNPERDLASGLLGPDKELSVIFAVFDENRSWYFNESMQNSSQVSPNTADPEFYNSNVIYSVNGIMFSRRQFALYKTDVTFWHVASVGTQSDFLSVYFTGNLFQYQGLHQSALTLFPMTGVTVTMEPEVIGEWEISAFDSSLKNRGMSIRYTVLYSSAGEFALVDRHEDEDISDYLDQLDFQPRSRRSHNHTVLVTVCNNKTQSVNTSGINVTEAEGTGGQLGCQQKEVVVEEPDEEIPLDILEEIGREGEWTEPQNGTEAEGEGGRRQKRQAEGNFTDVDISSGASEDGSTEIEIGEQAINITTYQGGRVKINIIGELLSLRNQTKAELDEGNEILMGENSLETIQSPTVEDIYSEEMYPNEIESEGVRLDKDRRHVELNLTADNNNTAMTDFSLEYDYYDQEVNSTLDAFGTDHVDPRSLKPKEETYYIAAEEITWDYGIKKPHQLIKLREMRRGIRKFLPEYKKVVFRAYWDKNFERPIGRGELQEHLGIMGPVIKAEINERFTVIFKNKASRPYSFHLHGVYDHAHGISAVQTHSPEAPFGVPGEPVPPGEARTYNWGITKKQGPSDSEFDCKAGAYYSTVDKERDLHSGLIGPLLICKEGTLRTRQKRQPNVQEFSLLFHVFDETKSWYMEENLQRHCTPPCEVNTEDPWYHTSNKFAAINGYVAETLPGLMAAQHQQVRWHLLNVGSDGEYHAVHFHGVPFIVHTKQEHRMGVFNLYPGVFGTVEMKPPNVGTWLVENTIGEYQLAGMRAKLLVHNRKCFMPLGMKSGWIEDAQITASDYIDNWKPRLARLDQSGYINAWMGRNNQSWLQVDLLRPTLLHGVQTQGVRASLRDHFTRIFTISYSLDQETWTTYRGNNTKQEHRFHGNLDSSRVRQNYIIPPIVARFVRIQPRDYRQKPALRLELMGCDLNSCSLPLGLEKSHSFAIPDKNITASSHYSYLLRRWEPHLARLHLEGSVNAWRPKNNNPHEWLQVDLGTVKRITGVITQGARSMLTQMMVTEFSVTFSRDGRSWSSVLEESSQREKIFQGNNDAEEEAFNVFKTPLFAQFLRIHPRGWINDIALRFELLGCDTQQ
ncbi:coagulation factor VIII isoform X1 [Xyrichtys novacula]|uniref:Coagulation factor VIII isoform X1 n=1 Tax=Xyrichtys novacula TaxID=13765 RepID=A0AAV1FC60_XYRNO|nr:coagulation factor VIII isoform X1 [Xyrichtys novacula]